MRSWALSGGLMSHLLAAFIFLFAARSMAEGIDVKGVDTDDNTTIEVHKGEKTVRNQVRWEVSEGATDIQGEFNPVKKDARVEWKKACDAWKKEFRDDNKENKIISMNCGTP